MERATSARFNSDFPATSSHRVDIEGEQAEETHHGSCSRCQELGNCDGKGTTHDDLAPKQSSCSCCQDRHRRNAPHRTRPDHQNGTALKLGIDPDNEGHHRCQEEYLQAQFHPPYGRKWEYFQGKNNFYCDGRFMTAPKQHFCLLSFGLILITFGLFIAFDGPYLANKVTVAIPIIGSVLFLLVVVNMVRTSCSDPGILPRASQQEHEFIERSYGGNSTTIRPPPRTKDIIVNGQTVKSKYCFTCKMFRPPRASHCGVCDNCVERFDHHCPFLGNCIGKRNYRSFYIFILSLSLLAVFVLSCSVTHLILVSRDKLNFLDALRESPTSAVVVLISFFGMWTVIGLAGFHTYLIAMEQTTNEDIKGLFGRANSKNPYSRGNFCLNCCFVLCGPNHPSLINPRGSANSDFLASLPKKNSATTTTAVAHYNYPPATMRANCGEASSITTRPGYPSFQITSLEASGTQSQNTPTMPVGTTVSLTSPRSNGQVLTSSNSNVQKAGTFPDTVAIGSTISDSKAYGSAYIPHIPIETIPKIVHQPRGSASIKSIQSQFQSMGNTGIGSTDNNSSVSLSLVQLDFPINSTSPVSNNFPALSRNQNKGEVRVTMDENTEEDASMLEDLTMINSPLHLDTIM